MASINKVILMGNLTRDPEIKNVGQTTLCTFGLAMGHKFKDRDGNMRDETCFVDGKLWGKSGQMFHEHFAKGSTVLVEGRLTLGQWQDKATGAKRSKHTVFVEQFHFVGERKAKAETVSQPVGEYVSPVDDIPF